MGERERKIGRETGWEKDRERDTGEKERERYRGEREGEREQ